MNQAVRFLESSKMSQWSCGQEHVILKENGRMTLKSSSKGWQSLLQFQRTRTPCFQENRLPTVQGLRNRVAYSEMFEQHCNLSGRKGGPPIRWVLITEHQGKEDYFQTKILMESDLLSCLLAWVKQLLSSNFSILRWKYPTLHSDDTQMRFLTWS